MLSTKHASPRAITYALTLGALSLALEVQGALVFRAIEYPGSVQLTVYGSFDTGAARLSASSVPIRSPIPGWFSAQCCMAAGGTFGQSYSSYYTSNGRIIGPNEIDPYGSFGAPAVSSTGDFALFSFRFGVIGLPQGYVSGSPLYGQSTIPRATLQNMRLPRHGGTWRWTILDGEVSDQITLIARVPEPGTFALGVWVGALGLLRVVGSIPRGARAPATRARSARGPRAGVRSNGSTRA